MERRAYGSRKPWVLNDPRVHEAWSEDDGFREDNRWSYWITLKDGWVNKENGTSLIHEKAKKECLDALKRYVERRGQMNKEARMKGRLERIATNLVAENFSQKQWMEERRKRDEASRAAKLDPYEVLPNGYEVVCPKGKGVVVSHQVAPNGVVVHKIRTDKGMWEGNYSFVYKADVLGR